MMDLDEAIQSFEDEMEKQTALGHSEHIDNLEQMSEWLKELKAYRSRSEIPNTCGDAISRQEVLDEIDRRFDLAKPFKQLIESMPSVTPQQRTGRWIKQNYGWNWQCSECVFVTPPSAKEIFTFCPNCGAKMEVEE